MPPVADGKPRLLEWFQKLVQHAQHEVQLLAVNLERRERRGILDVQLVDGERRHVRERQARRAEARQQLPTEVWPLRCRTVHDRREHLAGAARQRVSRSIQVVLPGDAHPVVRQRLPGCREPELGEDASLQE